MRLAHSLGAADVHLASMRENLCGLVVPSKVYGILAAGRPCVFLGPRESEVARTLERHECGTVLSGEQSFRPGGARLADCLSAWATDRERGRAAGRRAEKAAAQSGLNEAVAAFDKILREAAAQAEASRAEVSSPSLPCPAALPFQQNPSSTAK